MADKLTRYLARLAGDEKAQAAFVEDPGAALNKAGLEESTGKDWQRAFEELEGDDVEQLKALLTKETRLLDAETADAPARALVAAEPDKPLTEQPGTLADAAEHVVPADPIAEEPSPTVGFEQPHPTPSAAPAEASAGDASRSADAGNSGPVYGPDDYYPPGSDTGDVFGPEPGDAPAEPGPDGQDPFTGDGGNPGPDYGLLAC